MTITRRAFMRAGALGLLSFGADPIFLGRSAFAATQRQRMAGKTLVLLFQRGAVDGLSMVVPAGDPWYWRERQRIAIPRSALLSLDDHFSLHPRLGALKSLHERGLMRVVHSVGSPGLTRSHFEAQDAMESGIADRPSVREGWINRHLQAHAKDHHDTPFRSVAFGPRLPRTMEGAAPSLAIDNLDTFGIRSARARGDSGLTRAFESLYAGESTGVVAESANEGFEAIRMLREMEPGRIVPADDARYPSGRLGTSMRQIAQLIKSDVDLEIAFADMDGWDTHVNQGAADGQLGRRLQEFGDAIGAFVTDLGPRMRDVVILTMSEFGRTVRENGSGGTDHGHGTAMFVIGESVRGPAVAGRWPGLDPDARHQGRDLAVTTDYRDLFGEVLGAQFGPIDLTRVFPGHQPGPHLGVLG